MVKVRLAIFSKNDFFKILIRKKMANPTGISIKYLKKQPTF